MSRTERSRPPAWAEAEKHPIAWFAALLRGIDRGDDRLVDRARAELDRLGFLVVYTPPRVPERAGVAR